MNWLSKPLRILAAPAVEHGSRLANRLKRMASRLARYSPMSGGAALLDREYRDGAWDYLQSIDELSRFSVVVGYCHHLALDAAILEIGCGDGTLQRRLDSSKYAEYLGIDISAEAISRASAVRSPRASFLTADAEDYLPSRSFDLILFTECLEYSPDPLRLVERFNDYLTPGGAYVISMFSGIDTARSDMIWAKLGRRLQLRSLTKVTNGQGYTWIVKVLTPT